MIRSMTGYGKGAAEVAGLRITVELRSLNNRFADIRLRLPSELFAEESAIRRRVLSRVQRGRVEMGLDLERTGGAEAGVTLNRPVVQAVVDAVQALEREFGIVGAVDARTVLALPDVLQRARPLADLDESGRAAVHDAVESALVALDADRRREGAALAHEIGARLARMREIAVEVRRIAADLPVAAHRKLLERIETLTAGGPALDPGRLAQEAAFLADRADITEELVRLDGHIDQSASLVTGPDCEPVGKRLDFLLQEIHRETNTINSKSGDLEISRRALALKSEAEKVREQVQNLE